MKHIYAILFFFTITVGLAQGQPDTGAIEGFKMYPNPVLNGKVYIHTAKNEPKKILIYDVLGTKVMETTIIGKELNISDLDAGVYVLRVFEKDKSATRKLVVK